MYDKIYHTFITTGVARNLEVPVYQDIDGKVVSEDDRYGELIDLKMLHPEYILFANKTGLNTSSKDDRNKGGTKFVCSLNKVPKTNVQHQKTGAPYCHFFCTGQAILCAIIYMAEGSNVQIDLHTGIDI